MILCFLFSRLGFLCFYFGIQHDDRNFEIRVQLDPIVIEFGEIAVFKSKTKNAPAHVIDLMIGQPYIRQDGFKLLLYIKPYTPQIGREIETMNAPYIFDDIDHPFVYIIAAAPRGDFDFIDRMITVFYKSEVLKTIMRKGIWCQWGHPADHFRFVETAVDKTHGTGVVIIT